MRTSMSFVLMLSFGCDDPDAGLTDPSTEPEAEVVVDDGTPVDTAFEMEVVSQLREPWAMTFVPDGRMLITQKRGELLLVTQDGEQTPISGVPDIAYGGQGGLGDIIVHPDFASNGRVYISFAEPGEGGTRGAAVARATLDVDASALTDLEVIWRQEPKVEGQGHYAHRMLFGPDGYLFISSGDRQLQTPAQDLSNTLGTIVRLDEDGGVPADNPFADDGGVTAQIWSYGHRNPLGLALDGAGTLWEHEMGPRGGDEFQRIEPGENYGWPEVSDGDNYNGTLIPDHDTDDSFRSPEASWNPAISPAGLIIYTGDQFPSWRGKAIMGGLSSQALIWVTFACAEEGRETCEADRYEMGTRIREVEQGPDGAVWLLEDERSGQGGRLLKLVPEG